jgi:hypothetical protein
MYSTRLFSLNSKLAKKIKKNKQILAPSSSKFNPKDTQNTSTFDELGKTIKS